MEDVPIMQSRLSSVGAEATTPKSLVRWGEEESRTNEQLHHAF